MNNKKKYILVNILVICLYFMWPYFLNSVTNLLELSKISNLYISLVANFIFLFIIIYIYKNTLNKSYKNLGKNHKKHIFSSLKIFMFGLIAYALLNLFFNLINVSALSNQDSMIEMFKKIPIIFVLNTLFYYPIIEELVFKMSFKEIFKNKWSFVIFTGVFNALFQIVFSLTNITDLLYILPYSIFFCSLSYIYYKTDNIIYPILLRMCYNLIPCIIYIIDLFH